MKFPLSKDLSFLHKVELTYARPCQVRLPDGSRLARRFRKTDPLQAVFDFIDVQQKGVAFKPGSYNLVNSYPRKAWVDGTAGSLEACGVSSDTALFLEPSKV